MASIPKDKWEHYACGMVLASFVAVSLHSEGLAPTLAALFLGAAKEAWDSWRFDEMDWLDWLATTLGGLTINVFIWMGMLW